jgi:hypothetical protein
VGSLRSGRRGGRACTDDVWRLDLRPLARAGLLRPGRTFQLEWGPADAPLALAVLHVADDSVVEITSQWRAAGEWLTRTYALDVERTECHFGGTRAWWICPGLGCGRRVAVLHGVGVFACRHCYRLGYSSQRQRREDLAFRSADRLRAKLGWGPGVAYGLGEKPPRMHWSTFLHLLDEYNRAVAAAVRPAAERMREAERQLQRICGCRPPRGRPA